MKRMRLELEAWLKETKTPARRLSADLGKHRQYIYHARHSPWHWSLELAETLEPVVGFSERAWYEAWLIWEDGDTCPSQPWPITVRKLKANPHISARAW